MPSQPEGGFGVQRRVRWDKSGLPVQGLNTPNLSVGRDGSTDHDEFGGGSLGSDRCRFRTQEGNSGSECCRT